MSEAAMEDRLEPWEFAEALVDKVGGMDTLNPSLSGEEESFEPEPKVDATGRLHGDDGKFIGKGEDSEDEQGEDAQEGPEDELEPSDGDETEPEYDEVEIDLDDPEIAPLLEKYDGDIVKALKAANDAQSLIGRKSSEVEEVRGELAQMREFLMAQALMAQQNAANQGPPIADLIDEDPANAAQVAFQRQDVAGVKAAVDAWREEDPFQAAIFVMGLVNEFGRLQMQEELEARSAQASSQSSLVQEVRRVFDAHPDLDKHLPAIGAIAKERPILRAALEHGNPAEKAQALEDLYVIAQSRTVSDTSAEARAKVAAASQRETAEAKAKARVISASRRKSAGEQPTGVGEFKTAFRQAMGLPEDE